ncbi:PDR/VanB family oxidoreductase [Microbacterium sp. 18062]|uniref:PDR/VanB family oxidoreductase n=1 Tax=Microbacterium sp. 18062 TaxID=2681410 RepID=UPI00135B887E|nr:PDR/VanB family oxidoreductase [Microbacterium sp. 18062]
MSGDILAGALREHLVVEGVDRLSADVVSIRLVHPAGDPLPEWSPGDHIDLEFESGLTRQYSLCGDPADRASWSVAVRLDRAGRGGSAYAHTRLAAGDRIRAIGPKRRFPLEPAPHHVLVAGGIGITPILTMAEHLAAQGASFRLAYFDRGAHRMVFADRVGALGDAAVVVDRDLDASTSLAVVLADVPPGSLVYACGPKAMLAELQALVPAEALRFEDFAPEAALPVEDAASDAFEVQLGAGGDVHPVPAGCSLLDVLLGAGVDVVWSCREGNCASCETPVLEGVPDHRDVILTEDERAVGDVMFPCVSRARSARLVLDV